MIRVLGLRRTLIIILMDEALARVITVIDRRLMETVLLVRSILRCNRHVTVLVTLRRDANVMANDNATNDAALYPLTADVAKEGGYRHLYRVLLRLIRRVVMDAILTVRAVR